MIKTITLFLSFLVSLSAYSNELQSRAFSDVNGNLLGVVYTLETTVEDSNKPTQKVTTKDLVIAVQPDDASIIKSAGAVLINNIKTENKCSDRKIEHDQKVYKIKLTAENDYLVGKVDKEIIVTAKNPCFVITTTQELAIVLDGDWLKDPINGTSNFKFNLAE